MALTPKKRAPGKAAARSRRHIRVRKKVSGSATRPRLVVTRSSRHVFVQVVDDYAGHTLASASSMEADLRSTESDKTAKAREVGRLVATRAKDAGVETRGVRPWRQPLPRPDRGARRGRPRRWARVLMPDLSPTSGTSRTVRIAITNDTRK